MKRIGALALSSLVLLAACARGAGGGEPDSGIRGVVLAGPQCPVVQVGSPCPDEPMPDTGVRVLRDGDVVAEVRTGPDGRFAAPVPAGVYTVEAVLEGGGPPTAKAVTATVPEGGWVEVTVPVDTGIR